jgi:hypothetical protein
MKLRCEFCNNIVDTDHESRCPVCGGSYIDNPKYINQDEDISIENTESNKDFFGDMDLSFNEQEKKAHESNKTDKTVISNIIKIIFAIYIAIHALRAIIYFIVLLFAFLAGFDM